MGITLQKRKSGAFKVKGTHNTILVSDALIWQVCPRANTPWERKPPLTLEVVNSWENVLAGAASPISKCLEVMMNYTQCSIAEAITMACSNPAEMFSLNHLGAITPSKRDTGFFLVEWEIKSKSKKLWSMVNKFIQKGNKPVSMVIEFIEESVCILINQALIGHKEYLQIRVIVNGQSCCNCCRLTQNHKYRLHPYRSKSNMRCRETNWNKKVSDL